MITTRSMPGESGRRDLVFVLLSRKDRTLPLRLAAFLDWACDAGLMRLSGNAYQFRHLELPALARPASDPTGP